MNSFRMDANTTGDISIETLCLSAQKDIRWQYRVGYLSVISYLNSTSDLFCLMFFICISRHYVIRPKYHGDSTKLFKINS